MAEHFQVQEILESYCAHFAKSDVWVQKLIKVWAKTFEDTPFLVLEKALQEFVETSKETYWAPLSIFLQYVKKHHDGKIADFNPIGCKHCNYGSDSTGKAYTSNGFRHFALHFSRTPAKYGMNTGYPGVVVGTIPCNCQLGKSKKDGTTSNIDTLIDAIERTMNLEDSHLINFHINQYSKQLRKDQKMLRGEYEKWMNRKPNPKSAELLRNLGIRCGVYAAPLDEMD